MSEKAPSITIKGLSKSPGTNSTASPPGSISSLRSEDSAPVSALLRLLESQISNSVSEATPTPTPIPASATTSTGSTSLLPDATPRGPKAMIDYENRSRSAANSTPIRSDGESRHSSIPNSRAYPDRSRKRDLSRERYTPVLKRRALDLLSPTPRPRHNESDHYSTSRRNSLARSPRLTPPRHPSPSKARPRSPALLPGRSLRLTPASYWYPSSQNARRSLPTSEKLSSAVTLRKPTPVELFPQHKALSKSSEKKKYPTLSSVSIPRRQGEVETTVCYNCTGKGHSFMECTAGCGKCGKAGHRTLDCIIVNKIKNDKDVDEL